MFDTVGSRLNFPVVSGVAETFKLSFWVSARELSVLGATFQAGVYGLHGDAPGELLAEMAVQHTAQENAVLVSVPDLPEGHYYWELRATDAGGQVCRLLYGTLAALSSAEVVKLADEANDAELRELCVQVAGDAAAPLMLRWQATSLVGSFAEEAARAAEEARECVKRLEDVEVAVEEFRVFMVRWKDEVSRVLVMNPVTGTIWVGGVDTGQPYRGEDGKAPRVNAYGYWEVYEGGRWVTLPHKAIGQDGVDGDKIRRVLLGAVDELPATEERGVLYYVPKEVGDGYDLWAWVEPVGWLCVGTDPYGAATVTSLGLAKLSTGVEVKMGAPVGANAADQLMVPMATSSVPGAALLSSEVSDVGGRVHASTSGALLTDVATTSTYGAVKTSAMTVLPAGGIIGMNADGQLLAQLATADEPGAVRPGSYYSQLEGVPYLVSVGVDGMGRLATSLVRGGALQHKQPNNWSGSWIASDAFPTPRAHYLGLQTSDSFDQSQDYGLELLPGVATRLGGVYVVGAADDEKWGDDAAVMRARDVAEALEKRALKKDVYDKADIDRLCLKCDDGLERLAVMSLHEYQAMPVRDKKCVYLLTEE